MKEEFSTVSTRMTVEEKAVLIKYCEEHDETISRVVRKALREYLENHK